ncbi:unnamed protein product [Eruca vesicaria subsp. sativa]|uniref:Sm domain-containing protein n=1 Tax=Eruca vesicaria subsp. sativa TaxID=29727 RepID=A0ABC8M8N2_ERUVS|nr:unnamed protein product [Eruca vesicaria subsp. sativa]
MQSEARAEGNKLFGDGRYEDALSKYELYSFLMNLQSLGRPAIQTELICYLKLGKHAETVKECTKAIELNPNYTKALVRRAEAHEKLQHFEEALTVNLNANRLFVGTLRGFDQFMNLVVDNTVEVNGDDKRDTGMVVIRGNNICHR